MMMGLFRRAVPVCDVSSASEEGLEKALANLRVAEVHYKEAEAIIATFVNDFREKTRRHEQ